MHVLTKVCRKSQSSLSFSYCYRRNKPEADQSNAPRWTFPFTSAYEVNLVWKASASCFQLAEIRMH